MEELSAKEALDIMDSARDADGIWFGKKLEERLLPETALKEVGGSREFSKAPDNDDNPIEYIHTKHCKTCHEILALIVRYADGSYEVIQSGKPLLNGAKKRSLSLKCTDGHKNKVVFNG